MKLKYIITDNKVQHVNLAVEEFLTEKAKDDEIILMLWQNSPCVVIGKNQNPWAECNVEKMKEDMVPLVRRISGGGAVYHDLGNLNFTFIAKEKLFDKAKQTEVILQAVKMLGIDAEINGRNDLTVSGKKFSGHAYWSTKGCCYHHGTIMMSVFFDNLSKYLTPSKAKLQSKGVSSVKSRVTNLSEHLPEDSIFAKDRKTLIEAMQTALIASFELCYGTESTEMDFPTVVKYPDLIPYVLKYQSEEWIYGAKINFTNQIEKSFDWGNCEINLSVKGGKIEAAKIYSDSLFTKAFEETEYLLTETKYDKTEIINLCDGLLSMSSSDDSDSSSDSDLESVDITRDILKAVAENL